jgi:anti-anti-sigma regulatory factor
MEGDAMPMNVVCLKAEEDVLPVLREALEKLGNPDTEVVLDFSAVRRIHPSALGAMEQVAGAAAEKSVKVVLRGVNVDEM